MTAHPEATFGRVNAPEVAGVDCAAMRSVEAHARHLDYLMEHLLVLRHDSVATTDPHETELEWEKVRQWLAMVAGLRYVDVVPIGNNYWGLCERADEYEGAKNDLVSDVATEETRLLYAWGATERLMRALQLPTVSDKRANRRMYNRASQLITDSFKTKEPLEHYSCVLRHLRDHVTGDPEFASDYGLQEAAEQRAWRSAESTLLPLGAALRNLPAHGATAYGEPEEWAEERTDASARRLTRGAHAARLGSRGLLLSVQQLLATATVTNTHSDFEAEEFGWWTKEGDGGWQRRAAPSSVQVLHVAHLNPPPDFD